MVLPPMVYVGNKINFIGRIVTEDEGRRFFVRDAVPFLGSYWKVASPLYKYLWHYLENPLEWIKPDMLDKVKLRSLYAGVEKEGEVIANAGD